MLEKTNGVGKRYDFRIAQYGRLGQEHLLVFSALGDDTGKTGKAGAKKQYAGWLRHCICILNDKNKVIIVAGALMPNPQKLSSSHHYQRDVQLGDVTISLTQSWVGQQLIKCPPMCRHACCHSRGLGSEDSIRAATERFAEA